MSGLNLIVCSPSGPFPPEEKEAAWEKGRDRLDRWRLARVTVSPEEIGLCGCWRVIAVRRESLDPTAPQAEPAMETGCYANSLSEAQAEEAALLESIRGHWPAIENGTHYRRDVTLGEDARRTANRTGAEVLVSLRNLADGLYELERTAVDTLKSWLERQSFSSAWVLLRR